MTTTTGSQIGLALVEKTSGSVIMTLPEERHHARRMNALEGMCLFVSLSAAFLLTLAALRVAPNPMPDSITNDPHTAHIVFALGFWGVGLLRIAGHLLRSAAVLKWAANCGMAFWTLLFVLILKQLIPSFDLILAGAMVYADCVLIWRSP